MVGVLVVVAGCSSAHDAPPPDPSDAGGDDAGADVQGAMATEHGVVLDYGALLTSGQATPIKGLTITEGARSTTTDANGKWSLTIPAGATLSPIVSGTVAGDPYSTLYLPDGVADAGGDLDRGEIMMADTSVFQLERETLTSDNSKAVVHAVVQTTGTCKSAAGGTLTVTSPSGAKVMYFDVQGYPSPSQTSFADLGGQRPVADIYDVTPGVPITVQVSHPSCHQAPFPVSMGSGARLTGTVTTKASEPGDFSSAIVVVLQ
jgi:hypothetical protein